MQTQAPNRRPKRMTTFSFGDVMNLLSPDGQRQLIDWIRTARDERGAGWLEELKAEYPTFCWMVDLVANRTADEAFRELQAEFPLFPLSLAEGKIHNLHAALRAEIDRPRG